MALEKVSTKFIFIIGSWCTRISNVKRESTIISPFFFVSLNMYKLPPL